MSDTPTVVLTGANRGLGLGFARHYLAAGHRVCAVTRSPERADALLGLASESPASGALTVIRCDVGDPSSIEAAAGEIRRTHPQVDLLINNAGYYGTAGGSVADIDEVEVIRAVRVNTLGPMHLAAALLAELRVAPAAKVAHVTSKMGSITDNGKGGSWAYRMSKAALNMANANLALELKTDGIPCVVLHPGWVATDMGGAGAPLSVADSVKGMTKVIDRLGMADTGRFFNYDGSPIPW